MRFLRKLLRIVLIPVSAIAILLLILLSIVFAAIFAALLAVTLVPALAIFGILVELGIVDEAVDVVTEVLD